MAKLSEDQMEHLQLAALFHDTGFVKSYEDHETNSKAIAAEYLQSIDYPPDQIRMIQEVIEATRMPQQPTDKVGALLQDADLASLGSTTWETRSDLLRKELFAVHQKEYTDAEWVRYNMDFSNRRSIKPWRASLNMMLSKTATGMNSKKRISH